MVLVVHRLTLATVVAPQPNVHAYCMYMQVRIFVEDGGQRKMLCKICHAGRLNVLQIAPA